jgi:HK97 family phage portal protein
MDVTTLSLDRFRESLDTDTTLSVDAAYERVSWFRRGIDIRAEAVRSYPFDLYQGDEVVYTDTDPDPPDDVASLMSLMSTLAADLDMHGQAYALYEANRFGKNGAWRRLQPSTMKPEYSATEGLTGFVRTAGPVQTRYTMKDVGKTLVYLWMPTRRGEVGPGPGVGRTALGAATALDHTRRFQSAFFENGALSPTIITIDGFDTLAETERKRIANGFRRLMTGVKNAFNLIPVSGNTTVSTLMQPLNEMALDALTTQQREDVSTALGVPHSLLFSNAANFATASQDDLNFYGKAIDPLVKLIEHQLNEQLFRPAGFRLSFQRSRLEVYQQLEAQKADKYALMFDRGIITARQFAEMMNVEYLDEDEDETPEPEAMDDMDEMPEDEDDDNAMDEMQDELRRWYAFARKRFIEGSPMKALDFSSDVLPPPLHDSIVRALSHVETVDSVKQVFDDAQVWVDLHA